MRPRTFRLLALLAVAAALGLFYLTRDTGPPVWERPLKVVVYPENADGSAAAQAYIAALSPERFEEVEAWLAGQASRYELALEKPFVFELAERIEGAPGAPDYQSLWTHLQWGWRLRLWYWTFDERGRNPDITLVARYREAERADGLHSLGVAGMNLGAGQPHCGRVIRRPERGAAGPRTHAHRRCRRSLRSKHWPACLPGRLRTTGPRTALPAIQS